MFEVTCFYDRSARSKTTHQFELDTLVDFIESTEKPSKDQLPWLKLAHFGELRSTKQALRHDANVEWVTGCEADIDDGKLTFDDAHDRLDKSGIFYILYTSPSHTPETPRFRVVCPFSIRLQPSERAKMVARINGILDGHVADESFTLSQSYYFGRNLQNPHAFLVTSGGQEFIDLKVNLDQTARNKSTRQKSGNGGDSEFLDIAELIRRILDGENLHMSMASYIGHLAAEGVNKQAAIDMIGPIFKSASGDNPRYAGRWKEIIELIDWVYSKEQNKQKEQEPPKTDSGHKPYNSESLEGRTFMPIKWIIPNVFPEGTTLLAGKPKAGKSFLMLSTGLALTTEMLVLDEECEQRTVLYYALEDMPRRMKRRIDKVYGRPGWPKTFWISHDLPNLDHGGIATLEKDFNDIKPNLTIIDTLAAIKGQKPKNKENFQHDYDTVKAIADFGRKNDVEIIIVHHLRKQGSDDLFDQISGTQGLAAAADTLVILNRNNDGTHIAVRGRDVEPLSKTVYFDIDNGAWTMGDDYESAESSSRSTAKMLVMSTLIARLPHSISVAELASKTGLNANAVSQALSRLVKAGKAKRNSTYGTYEAVPEV